jgi:hypothetical protein
MAVSSNFGSICHETWIAAAESSQQAERSGSHPSRSVTMEKQSCVTHV